MTTLFDHTVLPPTDDASSLLGLVVVLKHTDHVALVGSDGNQIRLPFEVYEALRGPSSSGFPRQLDRLPTARAQFASPDPRCDDRRAINCNLQGSVLREDARRFQALDQQGEVVISSEI